MFFFKKKSGVTMDPPKSSHPLKEFVDDHGEFFEKALAVGAAAAVPVKMLFDIDALKRQGATLTTQMGTLTTQVGTLTTQVGTLTTQVGTLTTQMGTVLATMQRIEASTKRGPE